MADSEKTPMPRHSQAPDPLELQNQMVALQQEEARLSAEIQQAQEVYSSLPAGHPDAEQVSIQIQMHLRSLQEVQTNLHTIQQAFPQVAAMQTPLATAMPSGPILKEHDININASDSALPNFATFRLPERYVDVRAIGSGSFGMVVQATDTVTDQKVAIKKILSPWDHKIKAQRTYRELRLLMYLQESWPPLYRGRTQHENIVAMLGCWMDPDDLYIAMEHGGSDLSKIMQAQKVSTDHVMFFGYQILRAFKFLHSGGIIHRDLKPGNIACNDDCDLKILDFGLARQSNDATSMTGYVATRYYRAPEVILQPTDYGKSLDMWSFGCVIAELMLSLEWSMSKKFRMLPIGHELGAPQPDPNRPTVMTTEYAFSERFDDESSPLRIGQELRVWGNVAGSGRHVNPLGRARITAFEQDPASGRLAVTISPAIASTSDVTEIEVQTTPTQNMFAGRDRVQQLEEIARVLGKPSEEYITRLENDVNRRMHMCGIELGKQIMECQCGVAQREHWVRTLPDTMTRKPFRQLKRFELSIPDNVDPEQREELLSAHHLGIDLLEKILVYEPEKRLTAEEALEHNFFRDYHLATDEPVATHPFDNSCETWQLTCQEWMMKCQEEVAKFNSR